MSDEFRQANIFVSPDGKKILLSTYDSNKSWIADTLSGQLQEIYPKGIVAGWTPDGNSILLIAHMDGKAEILSMSIKTKVIKNLSNNPSNDYAPIYSDDGSFVYFISDKDGKSALYRMDTKDSVVIKITESIYAKRSSVGISPNNSGIVFECGDDGGNICVANTDGSDEKLIAHGQSPLWSPDGKYIVYESVDARPGVFVVLSSGDYPFYLMSLDTWGNTYLWLPQ